MPDWSFYYANGAEVPPEDPPSMLDAGDLTTVFCKWLAARNFEGDVNTRIREYLADVYTAPGEDLTTLFTRFEDHNREAGVVGGGGGGTGPSDLIAMGIGTPAGVTPFILLGLSHG